VRITASSRSLPWEGWQGVVTRRPQLEGRANSTNSRDFLHSTGDDGGAVTTHSSTLQKAELSVYTPCRLDCRNEGSYRESATEASRLSHIHTRSNAIAHKAQSGGDARDDSHRKAVADDGKNENGGHVDGFWLGRFRCDVVVVSYVCLRWLLVLKSSVLRVRVKAMRSCKHVLK
jgi:hypothetical protein